MRPAAAGNGGGFNGAVCGGRYDDGDATGIALSRGRGNGQGLGGLRARSGRAGPGRAGVVCSPADIDSGGFKGRTFPIVR